MFITEGCIEVNDDYVDFTLFGESTTFQSGRLVSKNFCNHLSKSKGIIEFLRNNIKDELLIDAAIELGFTYKIIKTYKEFDNLDFKHLTYDLIIWKIE